MHLCHEVREVKFPRFSPQTDQMVCVISAGGLSTRVFLPLPTCDRYKKFMLLS